MNRKHVFLLIVLLVVVLAVADARNGASISWSGVPFVNIIPRFRFNVNNMMDNSDMPRVSDASEYEIDAQGITRFLVNNTFGTVSLTGNDAQQIKVSRKITVYANSEQQAQEYMDTLRPIDEQQLTTYKVDLERTERQPAGVNGVVVDYVIELPQDILVDVNNSHGFVEIDNLTNGLRGSIRHSNQIDVTNVSGEVQLSIEHSSFAIADINGDSDFLIRHSNGDMKNLHGELKLRPEHSQVHVVNVTSHARIDARHSQINMNDLAGELDYTGSHTNFSGQDIEGGVKFDGNYGSLTASGIGAEVRGNSRHANVNITLKDIEEGYAFDLSSDFGQINSNVSLYSTKPSNNRIMSEGEYKGGRFPVRISAQHANITVNVQ